MQKRSVWFCRHLVSSRSSGTTRICQPNYVPSSKRYETCHFSNQSLEPECHRHIVWYGRLQRTTACRYCTHCTVKAPGQNPGTFRVDLEAHETAVVLQCEMAEPPAACGWTGSFQTTAYRRRTVAVCPRVGRGPQHQNIWTNQAWRAAKYVLSPWHDALYQLNLKEPSQSNVALETRVDCC